MPTASQVAAEPRGQTTVGDLVIEKFLLTRIEAPVLYRKEAVPVAMFRRGTVGDRLLVWVSADGKRSLWDAKANAPSPTLKQLLNVGYVVAAPDVFLTGEYASAGGLAAQPAVDKRYAGYNHCYNRSVIANRVHDILTTLAFAKSRGQYRQTSLAGFGAAGPWALLAKGVAGGAVDRTAVTLGGWRFRDVKDPDDPRMVPGGLKYGDLVGLALTAYPAQLYIADFQRLSAAERDFLVRCTQWWAGQLGIGNDERSGLTWIQSG
jgi:hypothetical protein